MAGNLKTNSVQLGESATASQNFVLQTMLDGTAKLARGNLGSTTQDVLTVSSTGLVTLPNATLALQDGLPTYACRAWCNFNGTLTGTNAPRAGGNVTSVTRNSTGNYTINFITAMPDTNYSLLISGAQSATGNAFAGSIHGAIYSTTQVQVITFNSAFASTDALIVNVSVFR